MPSAMASFSCGRRITLAFSIVYRAAGTCSCPRCQALFAVGVSLKSYTIMIFGRILFGLGGESQGVAQSTLVAIWFGEREIALALGINLSISRLGSVWNDNMSPVMFDYAGTPWQRCLF